MFWNNFGFGYKTDSKNISVFLLRVELSYKTLAQVSYKDEYNHVKIVRFQEDLWVREILSFSDNPNDICFKFFAHSANLQRDEHVKMTIEKSGEIVLSQDFIIKMDHDFTGWYHMN
jgi:hypothetical protein